MAEPALFRFAAGFLRVGFLRVLGEGCRLAFRFPLRFFQPFLELRVFRLDALDSLTQLSDLPTQLHHKRYELGSAEGGKIVVSFHIEYMYILVMDFKELLHACSLPLVPGIEVSAPAVLAGGERIVCR